MKRGQPNVSAERAQELWSARTAASGEIVTVQCQLATPMYGGGVHAGEVDNAMPIRASGIRGQLRFWWRLLHGQGCNSQELFEKECKLWGGIANDGPVSSQVAVRVACDPVEDGQLIQARSVPIPTYALAGAEPPMLLKHDYSFELKLMFHDDEKSEQIVETLRWWASFGGVGARTRRGFGAIKAAGDTNFRPVTSDEVQGQGGSIVTGPHADALPSWRRSVDALQTFRQVPFGRPKGSNRPGRSNWPEADTIRSRMGRSAPGHSPQIQVDRFPRAAFGLPIGFHFKDSGDPPDVTLTPSASDRMGSPLVLRPYFDGKSYRPMAMLLPGWEGWTDMRVRLHETRSGRAVASTGGDESPWPKDPAERERLASQLKPMRGELDPLTAFMRYFDERVNGKQNRR